MGQHKLKRTIPSDRHKAIRDKLIAILKEHADKDGLSAQEMLALAAHTVGQLIALQDQRKITPKMAMEIVARNIQQGNIEVVEGLKTKTAGSA